MEDDLVAGEQSSAHNGQGRVLGAADFDGSSQGNTTADHDLFHESSLLSAPGTPLPAVDSGALPLAASAHPNDEEPRTKTFSRGCIPSSGGPRNRFT